MDRQEFARRLMATFLEELHEHVEGMNRDLLALEKNPPEDEREEILKTLFRAARVWKRISTYRCWSPRTPRRCIATSRWTA